MTLFRLDTSIRAEGSASRDLADLVERAYLESRPGAVVRRDLGLDPLPSTAWAEAVAGSRTPSEERTARQRDAVALAGGLVDELLDSSAYLFATPLYNFGVSQHLKAWIDLVITDPRMGGGNRPLEGRPAALVVVRGGAYGPGTPRDGWDHGTSWVRRILAEVWGLDLAVVEREFTLVGVNPALEGFRDLADTMRAGAEAAARAAGERLAERVGDSVAA